MFFNNQITIPSKKNEARPPAVMSQPSAEKKHGMANQGPQGFDKIKYVDPFARAMSHIKKVVTPPKRKR